MTIYVRMEEEKAGWGGTGTFSWNFSQPPSALQKHPSQRDPWDRRLEFKDPSVGRGVAMGPLRRARVGTQAAAFSRTPLFQNKKMRN